MVSAFIKNSREIQIKLKQFKGYDKRNTGHSTLVLFKHQGAVGTILLITRCRMVAVDTENMGLNIIRKWYKKFMIDWMEESKIL